MDDFFSWHFVDRKYSPKGYYASDGEFYHNADKAISNAVKAFDFFTEKTKKSKNDEKINF
jgi:hypothetical protein